VTMYQSRSARWRSRPLVSIYALFAAFLFVLVVGLIASATIPPAPQHRQPALAPAPDNASAPFKPADEGKPTFSVVGTGSPTPTVVWSVLDRDDKVPDGYHQVGDPRRISLQQLQRLEKPLVDGLLCVKVDTPGWSIAPPEGVVDLTPRSKAGATMACQGGWSDPRAVPAVLTFSAKKGP
jgi:hypothetical protein